LDFDGSQHPQFIALEAQISLREFVFLNLHDSLLVATLFMAFDGMFLLSNSFHGLDLKIYVVDGLDPFDNSRPLQV
jgi:hypothetical protein